MLVAVGVLAHGDGVDVVGVIDVLFVGGGGGAEAFFEDLPLLVIEKMGRDVVRCAGGVFLPADYADFRGLFWIGF